MKRSTCYLLVVMSTIGCYYGGGLAKMDWIYKELRSEKEGHSSHQDYLNELMVP